MGRTSGLWLGCALAATLLAGCVADPYYDRHHHHGYYDDRPAYDEPPPNYAHPHDYKLPTIVCASKDGHPNRCPTDFAIRRADVDKRYSGSPCEYGRSWGYDRNEIWVDRGCRARFVVVPADRWR